MVRIATALLVLSACGELTAPEAQPLDPPAGIALYWQLDLDCAGLHGSPDGWQAIQWHLAQPDASGTFDCGGTPAYGCWFPRHDIYVLPSTQNDAYVIRHELLHDILNDPTHSAPAWTACHLH